MSDYVSHSALIDSTNSNIVDQVAEQGKIVHQLGFSNQSTAEEVARNIDLSGKTALVTGGSDGIGGECAKVLAKHGCRVYILTRHKDKGEKFIEDVKKEHAKAGFDASKIEMYHLHVDLAHLQEVRNVCQEWKDHIRHPIDILVLNAGVITVPLWKFTHDGFESQFGINYVSHFVLCRLLLDSINPETGRIVIVGSSSHKGTPIDLERVRNSKRGETGNDVYLEYSRSKLANAMFGRELNRRLRLINSKVPVYVCHPGFVNSNVMKNMGGLTGLIVRTASTLVGKTVQQGAACMTLLATAPEIGLPLSGQYFEYCHLDQYSEFAKNDSDCRALWEITSELVGMPPNEMPHVEESALSSAKAPQFQSQSVQQSQHQQQNITNHTQ